MYKERVLIRNAAMIMEKNLYNITFLAFIIAQRKKANAKCSQGY